MDKKKQHIDTEFIDQSWSNMSELLDKEMPVQKRKKRFIWIWLLGIATILMVGITYHFRTTLSVPSVPENLMDKVDKVAKKEREIIKETTIQKSKKITATPKISKQTKLPKNNNLNNHNFKSTKTLFSEKITNNTATELKEFKTPHANPFSSENEHKVASQKTIPQASILSPKKEFYQPNWSNHTLSVLPLPAFPLFHKERYIEIQPIVKPVDKNVSKWRLGLYAGGLTNKLGSFRAGFHGNLALSPKWTLHLGLGYASRNKKNVLNNNADIALSNDKESTETQVENPPPPPPLGSPDPTLDTSSNGTFGSPEIDLFNDFNYTKIHYVELPILLQYRFSKKWSIDFGGKISYIHGINYEFAGESNFTKDTKVFATSNSRIQEVSAEVINDFNFAAIGGFAYQISPKISAYTNYHFSKNYLTQTQTSSNLKKSSQQIEVGIRYYIK